MDDQRFQEIKENSEREFEMMSEEEMEKIKDASDRFKQLALDFVRGLRSEEFEEAVEIRILARIISRYMLIFTSPAISASDTADALHLIDKVTEKVADPYINLTVNRLIEKIGGKA